MLNNNIVTMRKNRGMSQEELASKLNVVRQTVSKWEKGLSVPDAEMLQRLAEVLETTVGQLLGTGKLPEQERSQVAEQLARINEQLVIKNCRSRLIWKIIGIVLAAILGLNILVVLGVSVYGISDSYEAYEVDSTVTTQHELPITP